MQTATVHGVQTSTESECRYSIACIHNAIKEYAEPELVTSLSRRTPREMHTFLASTDIAVTNLKDKEQMLPIVMRTNEHVQDMLKFSKRFVNQQQDQKEEDGIQQSVQEKEAHNESKNKAVAVATVAKIPSEKVDAFLSKVGLTMNQVKSATVLNYARCQIKIRNGRKHILEFI